MVDRRKTGNRKRTGSNDSRPTIGLLIGRLGDVGYAAQVWPGVADVAEERDVNLICFVGGALRALHEFDSQRNVVYDLVSPERVDGLLAMSGSIGQFVGPEQLKRFYERYRPLPMVSIAMAVEGIPSVLTDSETGMRSSITHLINVHKFRHIAFIRGPETNPEAEQRYKTYIKVLAEHGIPFDPDLVVSGNYLAPAGVEAVRLLLDERKAKFEAIASANDEMVLGSVTALRERGLRVPNDVSVVGFDDLEEAKFASPPLTTIRQPLYEQGRRAAETLLALMAGEDVPEQVTLPTELVIRQSCGCQLQDESPTIDPPAKRTGKTFEAALAAQRKHILSDMTKAAGISAVNLDSGWAERLLEAFSITLNDPLRNDFLQTLDETLRQVGANNGDVMQWRRMLFVLRRHVFASLANEDDRSNVEKLLQRSQTLVGEIAQWAQAYRRLQAERRAFNFTIGISDPLMTAFDVAGLTEVVARQLPRLGIRSCYLSLYEQPAEGQKGIPTEWSRLILAFNENGRIELEPDGQRFQSRRLVPDGILPRKKRYAVLLEPLHFRDETQLGFIIFEPLETKAGALREALSRQISTALKGALILQERKRAEEALAASEERYRILAEASHDMIFIIGEDGNVEYVNDFASRQFGLQPELIIGMKMESLFFADVAERQHQSLNRVMATGTPAYIEAPSGFPGGERWLGTWLVPLRNRAGRTTSVMGVSRDITDRIRVDQALKEYSERLEDMVGERTAELQDALRKAQLADQLKSEFISNINHELRTPLTNLVLYHQMLLADPAVKTQERLDVIGREIQRLRILIEDMLKLSRLDTGQVIFHPLPQDLNRIIQTLVSDRRTIAEERGLTLTIELQPGLPAVWLDEVMVVQVISNLMTNALNYTPAGGQVHISTRRMEDHSGKSGVAFIVQDTGSGISQEDLPHLFERFYRGKAGHAAGVPGTGLGLAIVKQLVEKHHGRIEVENVAKGHGAVFTIWLPVEQEQEAN